MFSTSNAFAEQLLVVRELLAKNATAYTREADRLSEIIRSMEADLKAAAGRLDEARKANDVTQATALESQTSAMQTNKARLEGQIKDLRDKSEALMQRHATAGGSESLTTAMPSVLVAINGGIIKATSVGGDRIEGDVLIPLSSTAGAAPGQWRQIVLAKPESSRKIRDQSVAVLEELKGKGLIRSVPNFAFFEQGDSREPELAGVLGALVGSALTMLVTLALCLPIGVLAAIYLEEFAPKNWLTRLVEVNINNLAAVPSIVFGLLGLAVFLNFFGLPRSAPLVGGLVLALLVLPTIIIASRAALRAVPPSIREAALGVGASKQQAIFHHVLPLGDARHPDGYDYRYGARTRRVGTLAADRHGRLYRRRSRQLHASGDRAAGSDLPLVRSAGGRFPSQNRARHHRAADVPVRHERICDLAAQEV